MIAAARAACIRVGSSASFRSPLSHSRLCLLSVSLSVCVCVSSTVFIDAEEEILGLMSSDSFGRFKSSDLFKTCIETVNSPYTAILRKLYLL